MENLTHYPVLVFAAAFFSLSLASETGAWLRRRYSPQKHRECGVFVTMNSGDLRDQLRRKPWPR
jgi:hypothetical protein